jgi:hypothetical protein
MQTAEERRLNRMGQYGARVQARRAYGPEGAAIEGNAADDALMVDQGWNRGCQMVTTMIILSGG